MTEQRLNDSVWPCLEYPALAAEPVTVRRGRVSVGDDVAGVKLFTGPIEPEQTASFRGLVERVCARLHEEIRRDIMARLARAGRRHHGAIL